MVTSPDDDLMLGQPFGPDGRYLVQQKLGQGGFGVVYLSRDVKRDRSVALKILRESEVDSVIVERFWREGSEYGAAFKHPNIVRVHAYGRQRGRFFIAFEFIEGKTLSQILESEGVFAIDEALRVAREVASGLSEAHRAKVVHRDLKPSNVMVRTSDRCVKILDFGIAKKLSSRGELTETLEYMGTDGYAAPEQTRGRDIDHRADIFSLGVIVYELITGRFAFDGRSERHIVHAVRNSEPIPPSEFNASVTSPVASLIAKMIKKNPVRRHANMGEVIEEVDRIRHAIATGIDPDQARGLRFWLRKMFEGPS